MKRIAILTFLLAALSLTGRAQSFIGIGTTAPGSSLTVNGSLGLTYRTILNTDYNLSDSDSYVAWSGTAADSLFLPAALSGAGNFGGRMYFIKNTSTSQVVNIQAAGAEQIDNQSGATISSLELQPGSFTILISTGLTSGTTWETSLVGTANSIKPFFRATKSAYTPGATLTALTGFTETADDRNNFNPTTGQFTAPEDGYYLFTYSTSTALGVSGVLSQMVTGSGAQTINLTGASGYTSNFTNTTFLKLAKGAAVQMSVLFSGTGTVNSDFAGTKL